MEQLWDNDKVDSNKVLDIQKTGNGKVEMTEHGYKIKGQFDDIQAEYEDLSQVQVYIHPGVKTTSQGKASTEPTLRVFIAC